MHPSVNRMPESPKPQGVSANRRRPNFVAPMLDKFAMIPTFACAFSLIVAPLLLFLVPPGKNMFEARLENRIFWPIMAAISIVLFVTNRYRPDKLNIPPHITWLVLYLAFAGTSSLWALEPESSFIRFIQQVMIVTMLRVRFDFECSFRTRWFFDNRPLCVEPWFGAREYRVSRIFFG